MLQIMINGHIVTARDGATIYEAVYENKYAGTQFDIDILSLQYLKGVHEEDESGLCIVEVQGEGIVNAAKRVVEPEMRVITDSQAVRDKQKEALEKILKIFLRNTQ